MDYLVAAHQIPLNSDGAARGNVHATLALRREVKRAAMRAPDGTFGRLYSRQRRATTGADKFLKWLHSQPLGFWAVLMFQRAMSHYSSTMPRPSQITHRTRSYTDSHAPFCIFHLPFVIYNSPMLRALLKTMRPRQWAKNIFVFAALVFDHKLFQPNALWHTLAGFGLLCLLSSVVYIVNDLADIEKDRQHPKKRLRPLASGQLKPAVAVVAVVSFLVIAVPLAFWLNIGFGIIALIYLLINLLYSFWLKHIVLIDVLMLSSGYLLRAAGGAVLVNSVISPWLYTCLTLGALFIGFGKRRGELVLMQDATGSSRKVLQDYSVSFLDELINLVATATIVTYSFYTFSAPNLPANHAMMLTIPFVLYGIFRYLYLIHMKGEGGAPDELIFIDRPLLVTGVLWGLACVLVLYLSRLMP
jgi:4-hydroxybenzoate polyprenyltransferase